MIFIKTHSAESRCVIGPENIYCLLVRASILHAGAVKGLTDHA